MNDRTGNAVNAHPAAYRSVQKWLHWLTAGCIMLLYAMFDGMGRPFGEGVEEGRMPYTTTTISHIILGSAVLVMTAFRMLLRLRHGAPAHPANEPVLATYAARLAHFVLYALIIALPVAGLLAWFLPSETLAELHALGTTVLIWVITGHVLAVVVHQIWWRTDILKRMI